MQGIADRSGELGFRNSEFSKDELASGSIGGSGPFYNLGKAQDKMPECTSDTMGSGRKSKHLRIETGISSSH